MKCKTVYDLNLTIDCFFDKIDSIDKGNVNTLNRGEIVWKKDINLLKWRAFLVW